MTNENTESEEVKRLRAELAFSQEMRRNESLANQERIKAPLEIVELRANEAREALKRGTP